MDVREKLPIDDAILILTEELNQMSDGYTTHLAYGGKGDPAMEANLNALELAISALESQKRTAERKMIMPKNVMCKNCNNYRCDWCEKVVDSPDPNMPRTCQYFWERTNADRIRAMSDDELAEVLGILVHCGGCPMRDNCKVDNLPCNNVLLEWLKQPAEG